jgi:hypothetical protein
VLRNRQLIIPPAVGHPKNENLNIMNIFKKHFGNSDKPNNDLGNVKPDVDKLLSSDNINNSIIELDNYTVNNI